MNIDSIVDKTFEGVRYFDMANEDFRKSIQEKKQKSSAPDHIYDLEERINDVVATKQIESIGIQYDDYEPTTTSSAPGFENYKSEIKPENQKEKY